MRNLLKILSILMIAGGLVSLILSLFAILFSARLSAIGGNGAWLILYPVIAFLANTAEFTAGIFGVRVKANQAVPFKAFLAGLITVVLNVAAILIAKYPLGTQVSWVTWVLCLLVPVLFTILTVSGIKNRK